MCAVHHGSVFEDAVVNTGQTPPLRTSAPGLRGDTFPRERRRWEEGVGFALWIIITIYYLF